MSLHGRVLAVSRELAGDFLAVGSVVGTATLVLTDAADFNETGGDGVLDPDKDYGGPFAFSYDTVDFDTASLNLTNSFPSDVPEGAVVRVTPEYEVIVAYVQPDDPDEPPLMARVPYSMRAQLPLGQRSDVLGEDEASTFAIEEVIVDLVRGSWMVTDILGIAPELIADLATDGVAPQYSPTPQVEGGIGSLYVRWEAIPDNPDPVKYEVHMSTDPFFVPSLDTFVGEVDGTFFVIQNLPTPLTPPPPPPAGEATAVIVQTLPPVDSAATAPPPPPPPGGQTEFVNIFNCGTLLDSVTGANSGGGNGDAFQVVNYGNGTIIYATTQVLQNGSTVAMTTGSTSGGQWLGWQNPDLWNEVWTRCYYLMVPVGTADHELMRFAASGGRKFSIYRNASGNLFVGDVTGAQVGGASQHAFTSGQKFRVEVHATIAPTTVAVEVMLNWGTDVTAEAANEIWSPATVPYGFAGADEIDFGRMNSQSNGEQIIIDAPAVATDDWIGPW